VLNSVGQSELFAAPQALPSGLLYCPGFIDTRAEQALLAAIESLPVREARFRQYTARRRVVRFGEGDYLEAEPDQPTDHPRIEFPDFLLDVREQVAAWLGMPAGDFVHALCTEYAPGTPIGWHRDAPHFEIVAGISLASACRMRFRPLDKARHDDVFARELQPRSLYVMRDDIRWFWQHNIPPVKATRYSITLRTLRAGPPPRMPR
jgi:alkylated DNA repair dioxygenase AlkB